MTLADLSHATPSPDEHRRALWKMIAFVGRYGKTPAPAALGMEIPDLVELSDALASLLTDEAEAARRR